MPGRDYTANGAYFITVCSVDREPVFGTIADGHVCLNAFGNVVADTWRWLPLQYSHVTLDEWCVMPDHLHGILVLGDSQMGVGGSRTAPTGNAVVTNGVTMTTGVDAGHVRRKSVGGLIGAFKTVSTKEINRLRNTPGAVVWQRDFWDHVVRNQEDLLRIRAYIRENAHL
jgi:putative transposase